MDMVTTLSGTEHPNTGDRRPNEQSAIAKNYSSDVDRTAPLTDSEGQHISSSVYEEYTETADQAGAPLEPTLGEAVMAMQEESCHCSDCSSYICDADQLQPTEPDQEPVTENENPTDLGPLETATQETEAEALANAGSTTMPIRRLRLRRWSAPGYLALSHMPLPVGLNLTRRNLNVFNIRKPQFKWDHRIIDTWYGDVVRATLNLDMLPSMPQFNIRH